VKKKKLKKRRDETKSAKKRRKRARREKVLEKILREKAERDAQLANQKVSYGGHKLLSSA